MKDLKEFGTAKYPLRPSGMRILLTCNWRSAYVFFFGEDGESGEAADTGSAMHAAAAAMHKGNDTATCLKMMVAGQNDYPRADLQDAANLFLVYSSDPRNRNSEVVLVEEPIEFTIEAAPNDPTGERIAVIGHVDQVRKADGRLRGYDIKTSKKDPISILHNTTFQMAAYCMGAAIKLGQRVDPGAIIMPRRYTNDVARSPVFYHFPWTFDDIEQIMLGVRTAVANVRAGHLFHVPNQDCFWCPLKSPDVCLPKLQQLKLKN